MEPAKCQGRAICPNQSEQWQTVCYEIVCIHPWLLKSTVQMAGTFCTQCKAPSASSKRCNKCNACRRTGQLYIHNRISCSISIVQHNQHSWANQWNCDTFHNPRKTCDPKWSHIAKLQATPARKACLALVEDDKETVQGDVVTNRT